MKLLAKYVPQIDPRFLLGTATVLGIIAFLVVDIWDGDIFWHIAIGRYILEHRQVPTFDLFSVAGADLPYHDSQWLFQAITALVDKAFGLTGVHLLMLALWGAIFFVTYRSLSAWVEPGLAFPLLFLVAFASSERFTPRPEVVSYLMVALFYRRLQLGRYRTLQDRLFLASLQALWTNAHGIFVLGPFMIGCYAAAAWRQDASGRRPDLAPLAKLLFLDLAATLVNPSGAKVWPFALFLFKEGGQLTASAFYQSISELKSPFGSDLIGLPSRWAYLAILTAFLFAAARSLLKRTWNPGRLLIVCAMALFSGHALRNVPLFTLTAGPFVAEQIGARAGNLRFGRRAAAATGIVIVILALLPVTGLYYRYVEIPYRFRLGPSPSAFSEKLPLFLTSIGFKGSFFNDADLGGYALFHGRKPLVDTRFVHLPVPRLEVLVTASSRIDILDRLDDQYHFEGLLLQNRTAEIARLMPGLAADRRWKPVYVDQAASFWLRDTPAWQHVPDLRSGGNPWVDPAGLQPTDFYYLAWFYQSIGRPREALALISREPWRTQQALDLKMNLEFSLGDSAAAMATAAELARKYPDHFKLRGN